uniref:protein-serine/threonine phosphatase n=1 Tax=Electrophorus electricus TaxID=8005 RepID=A0AAY5ESW7_ELEEL
TSAEGRAKVTACSANRPRRVDGARRRQSSPPPATRTRRSLRQHGPPGNSNSLLLKRRRLKRNLSAASAATTAASVVPAGAGKMNSAPSSALHTRSLDRKTLLRHRQNIQLQPSDRQWIRADLHRGSIYVHDKLAPSYPRPVLCTLETTAGEVAQRFSQLSGNRHGSPRHVVGTGGLPDRPSDRLRLLLLEKDHDGRHRDFDVNLFSPDTHPVVNILDNSLSDLNSNTNLTTPNDEDSIKRLTGTDSCGRNSGSDVESSAFDDLSSGARLSEHRDSLSDDMILGTDASVLSPTFDSATEGQDTYGSSSDELELDCPSIDRVEPLGRASMPPSKSADSLSKAGLSAAPAASQPGNRPGTLEPGSAAEDDSAPALYVQLHGEAARRLGRDERPLQIQNDFLFKLGFKDPWRVQEEGMNTELGSVLRFYSGKPHSLESSERVQLSGTFNVRKGKLQLPVSRWSRRQVILCGTCLMVSSVKASHAGKMHILPLIGGKVEEVKKHSHCLAFSSAGPQSHTYYISFDSFTEHLRWHRHAAKMVSQRISSVDLSCCSLEKLPPNLLYSQDLTHLNLKHNFLPADPSLQQLQRFSRLRSLNLSNNQLGSFPLALSSISTLTELNLSCNCLSILHPSVGDMHNLQTLLLDGNLLWSLPAELGSLQRLVYLGLSFNRFTHVPQVLERLPAVERLCMAGNMLQQLPLQVFRLLPVKHVDLRLNQISVVVPDEPDFLRHVTQLDVRDNRLSELDASLFPRLEVLHCQRNRIARLQLRGAALKALYAANNEVHELEVKPAASNVTYVDISRNRLEVLPDWLSDSKKLEVLDVSHNCIRELPQWLFCSSSLRKVLVAHNALQRLPERVEWPAIEVLDIQHNQLVELPCNLFLKSDSLRCLNASANKLENLPPSSLSEESNSVLQELYLTNNHLTDKCVPLLTGHTHLRILHMAYNHLQTFPASKMAKLEELEEVDLSGNRLKSVPTTILNCKRMHTLIAHSNAIEVFPEAMQLMDMKCVDLSCNELVDITLPENLPPKLQELDLTGNPRLNLDHKTLEQLNNIRCFRIDPPPTSFSANEASGGPAVWSHGYTEASGVKNKLCVAALSVSSFCGSREALYGVFDGDRNVEVPYLLQCTMNDVLAEELHKTKSEEDYMTNTFLVMQRKLGTAGQKLGGSAVLCHIRHDPTDPAGCFTLTAANVGKCQAVLCRDGKALPLSLLHNIGLDEEYSRVRQHKAIITEDNKVNGVTDSTRIMGYSFLYPAVLPRPYVHTLPLTPRDEFFILGSRGLFESLEPDEAVEAVRKVPDALAAAKKLCTLAQAYGCTDSLSAVVVQLSVAEDCCCCCCSAAGGLHASTPQPPPSPGPGLYPPSSAAGVPPPSSCSEISSEVSASEMSSEVGSTASSDEPPVLQSHLPTLLQPNPRLLPCCSLHPTSAAPAAAGSFQRQLSGATFSGALSDNGLDSEDEEPIAGVFSNGSRVEVEADVHCLRFLAAPPPPPPCVPLAPDEAADPGPEAVPAPAPAEGDKEGNPAKQGETWSRSQVKRRGNGSVAPHERSHNLIEVATEVPSKKSGGYFTAPAQPDPDDQFIIPPELEEEVKEIMKQHQQEQLKPTKSEQPTDYYDTPL